jgi:hypothetical protein
MPSADTALGGALLMREGVELVNEALGMDPAQAVLADIELTGVVADDNGVGQKAVRLVGQRQGADLTDLVIAAAALSKSGYWG